MSNVFKSIAGYLLDWTGLANVPAAIKALSDLKGTAGQIIEIGGTNAQGGVTALTAVEKPTGSGNDSGQNASGSFPAVAANLLITILRGCATFSSQTANIDALEAVLMQEEAPTEGVYQTGSILTIISDVTVTRDGDTLEIV